MPMDTAYLTTKFVILKTIVVIIPMKPSLLAVSYGYSGSGLCNFLCCTQLVNIPSAVTRTQTVFLWNMCVMVILIVKMTQMRVTVLIHCVIRPHTFVVTTDPVSIRISCVMVLMIAPEPRMKLQQCAVSKMY